MSAENPPESALTGETLPPATAGASTVAATAEASVIAATAEASAAPAKDLTEREKKLKTALFLFEREKFPAVEFFCRQLQKENAQDESAAALNAYAVFRQDRFPEAAALMRDVLRLNPEKAAYYADLGVMLLRDGRYDEAENPLRMARALDTHNADTAFYLASACFQQDKTDAGVLALDAFASAHPESATRFARIQDLLTAKRFDEAKSALDNTDETDETDAADESSDAADSPKTPGMSGLTAIYIHLGIALYNAERRGESFELLYQSGNLDTNDAQYNYFMGARMLDKGDLQKARRLAEKAIARDPAHLNARLLLAQTLERQGDLPGAIDALTRLLEIAPDLSDAHALLGIYYQKQNQPDKANACLQRALELNPSSDIALNALALVCVADQHFDQAEALFKKALAAHPANLRVRSNYGIFRLMLGDFEAGWRAFENRILLSATHQPVIACPAWQGEPLDDKTLLIWFEQGLGDTIQFVRYLPDLRARYPRARFFFQCYPSLVRVFARLLARSRVELLPTRENITEDDLSAKPDYMIPLCSLPLALNQVSDAMFPADIPYIDLPDPFLSGWARYLDALIDQNAPGKPVGKKVGVVWSGSKGYGGAKTRNMTLELFAPLFNVPGITWISLQKLEEGNAAESLAQAGLAEKIIDPMAHARDFADTAAIAACLDLVISVDTSVLHLAGALGVPVWLLNRLDSCWRWQTRGSDSAWYPTMRIFRQKTLGDWPPVVEEAARALNEWVNAEESRAMWTLVQPTRPDAAFSLALSLVRRKRTETALQILDELHARHPDFAWQYVLRGTLLMAEKQFEPAANAYSEAITRGIETPDVVSDFGLSLFEAGFHDAALEALLQSGKANLEDPHVNLCLGKLFKLRGDADKARFYLDKSIGANPWLLETHDALAELYDALGNTTDAAAVRAYQAQVAAVANEQNAVYDQIDTMFMAPAVESARIGNPPPSGN